MSRIISSRKYGEELCKALGIDLKETPVRRIVIDVAVDEPVKVHVEYLGTEALLDVKLPANAVEIVTDGK